MAAEPLTVKVDDEQVALTPELLAEIVRKANLYDYLRWLQEYQARGFPRLRNKAFLCVSSDGKVHWGKTFDEAVETAFNYNTGKTKA